MNNASTIALFALVGAFATTAAHSGTSAYHDGLRPLLPEYRSGRFERRELATRVWHMSTPFVWWFAMPFTTLTGTAVSHALFLPSDALGVRATKKTVAAATGATAGLLLGAFALGIRWALEQQRLADVDVHLDGLGTIIGYLLMLLPVFAVFDLAGHRLAIVTTIVVAATRLAVDQLEPSTPGDLSADGAALLAGTLTAVAVALRNRQPVKSTPPFLLDNLHAARSSLVYLLPVGIGAAVLAHNTFLAGDPGAALLIGAGRRYDAAAFALFSTIAFLTAYCRSYAVSGAAATQGIPDIVLAAGFVAGSSVIAGIAGAAVITTEILAAPLLLRLVDRFPDLASLGTSMRAAMSNVLDIGVLIATAMVANSVAAEIGVAVVVGAHLLNEALGRPVLRVAVGATALVGVAAVATIFENGI